VFGAQEQLVWSRKDWASPKCTKNGLSPQLWIWQPQQ